MKLSDMRSHDDIQCSRRAHDPAYRAEVERLALAEAVSIAVVRYRAAHQMSQTAFAAELGWKQPHVARLERGDVTPSLESLQRLARAGVIEVHVEREGTRVQELATA